MHPKHRLAKSIRSGLLRLRTWFLCYVCRRSNVVHVLTHLILQLLLRTVLVTHGVPEWLTEVLIAFLAIIVAHAINDLLDDSTGKKAEG